jgi:hypothetical protein
MTPRGRTPTREHDLRTHLGVVLIALQMISRPPTTPLTDDQQELIDIIKRATKSMQALLDKPVTGTRKKS